ncbi:hypothetical protein GCM10028791_35020 [Echinicola sediminis]
MVNGDSLLVIGYWVIGLLVIRDFGFEQINSYLSSFYERHCEEGRRGSLASTDDIACLITPYPPKGGNFSGAPVGLDGFVQPRKRGFMRNTIGNKI